MGSKGSLSKQQSAAASSTAADVVRHDDSRLSALDPNAFTQRISFHPTSPGGNNRAWVRLLTIDGISINAGAHAQFLLAGSGDYGGTSRSTMLIHINQRGSDTVTVKAWAWSYTASTEPLELYTKQISTFVFELWGKFADFNQLNYIHVLHTGLSGGSTVTFQGDSVTTTAPTPLSTAYPILDYDTQLSGKVDTSDARLTNARTPTAHASSHAPGGGDDLSASFIPLAQKGASGGVPALSGNVLPRSYLQYANTTQDGTVVLAGDLGGTATSPTVPGLAGKAPLSHVHAGADISSGTVAYARLPVGSAASTVAAGDDSRLTNARTPTAHAASHASGQSDAITPAAIGAAPALRPISTKTAAYTLVDTDGVILASTASAGFTVTVPTAVGRAGRSFTIKKIGGNPLTIASNGGTIDGSATENISSSLGFRELTSDGTNWYVTGGRVDPVVVSGLTVVNGATLTLDSTAGHVFRATASGAAWTLGAPSNPIDSDVMNVEVLASVASTMTINSAILLTTGISTTVDIASGKRWFGGLRHITGVGWFLLASTVQA